MFSTTTMASSTTKPTAIVSAISETLSRLKWRRYIAAKEPSSASGTVTAGNERRPEIAQEQQDHQHHQADRERQRELDVLDRSPDRGRAVLDGLDLDRGGTLAVSRGNCALIWSTVSMTLAPGCLKIDSRMLRTPLA